MAKKRFHDLYYRSLFALVAVIGAAALIYFADHIVAQILVVTVISFITALASLELIKIFEKKNLYLPAPLILFFSVSWIVMCYLSALGFSTLWLQMALFFAFLIVLLLANFVQVKDSLLSVSASIFVVLYITIPFSFLLFILFPAHWGVHEDGRMWVAYLITVTKGTDVAAYFAGKLWGRKKLATHLSPKKTFAGALGGCVGAVVLSWIFYELKILLPLHDFSLTMAGMIWLGITLGVLSQFGDLVESLFKRDASVKDSSSIPGVGGVLDVVDSLLLTIPYLLLYLSFN